MLMGWIGPDRQHACSWTSEFCFLVYLILSGERAVRLGCCPGRRVPWECHWRLHSPFPALILPVAPDVPTLSWHWDSVADAVPVSIQRCFLPAGSSPVCWGTTCFYLCSIAFWFSCLVNVSVCVRLHPQQTVTALQKQQSNQYDSTSANVHHCLHVSFLLLGIVIKFWLESSRFYENG